MSLRGKHASLNKYEILLLRAEKTQSLWQLLLGCCLADTQRLLSLNSSSLALLSSVASAL